MSQPTPKREPRLARRCGRAGKPDRDSTRKGSCWQRPEHSKGTRIRNARMGWCAAPTARVQDCRRCGAWIENDPWRN